MKPKTLFLILFFLVLYTLIITPFEARFFKQDLTYMYILNISEVFLFSFGVFIGYIVKSRSLGLAQSSSTSIENKDTMGSITSFPNTSTDNDCGDGITYTPNVDNSDSSAPGIVSPQSTSYSAKS